jgi:hypothetical protein
LAKPNKDIDPTGKSTKNIVYRDVLEGWTRFVLPSGWHFLLVNLLTAYILPISFWNFSFSFPDLYMFVLCSSFSSSLIWLWHSSFSSSVTCLDELYILYTYKNSRHFIAGGQVREDVLPVPCVRRASGLAGKCALSTWFWLRTT